MPKGSPELTASRKEEIVNACEKLYRTMAFKEITLKEISVETSFSRPSIYNYFQTKEEIFLALMQREYERWTEAMNAVMEREDHLTRQELAQVIARTLTDRPELLRLLSMNLFDMEDNVRPEKLAEFKAAYGASLDAVARMMETYIPEMGGAARQRFLYAFFPFLYGIFPYTSVTEKQKTAMEQAGIPYVYQSAYDLTCTCLNTLLSAKEE